jgi:hypothetical protein
MSLPENKGYERVPGGIWEHSNRLSDREKAELFDLADFVGESDLCSRLLPAFIRCVESDTGHRCHPTIHTIVDRIEEIDAVGLHRSPSVVARIFREYASWESQRREVVIKPGGEGHHVLLIAPIRPAPDEEALGDNS